SSPRDPLFVNFTVPQSDFARIHVGTPVQVEVDSYPGQTFSGKITAMGAAINTATRQIDVQATVPNPKTILRPGMFGNVTVIEKRLEKVLTVPASAITYNTFGDFVYVVEKKPSMARKARSPSSASSRPVSSEAARYRFCRGCVRESWWSPGGRSSSTRVVLSKSPPAAKPEDGGDEIYGYLHSSTGSGYGLESGDPPSRITGLYRNDGARVPGHHQHRGYGNHGLPRRQSQHHPGLHHHPVGAGDRQRPRHRLHDLQQFRGHVHHHRVHETELQPRRGGGQYPVEGPAGDQRTARRQPVAGDQRDRGQYHGSHVYRLLQQPIEPAADYRLPPAGGPAQARGGQRRGSGADPAARLRERQYVFHARLAQSPEDGSPRDQRVPGIPDSGRQRLHLGGREHPGDRDGGHYRRDHQPP
ncbi:efflux transporter, RND family, MFP subunit, partial [Acidithiobacillus sp. GGI-221]